MRSRAVRACVRACVSTRARPCAVRMCATHSSMRMGDERAQGGGGEKGRGGRGHLQLGLGRQPLLDLLSKVRSRVDAVRARHQNSPDSHRPGECSAKRKRARCTPASERLRLRRWLVRELFNQVLEGGARRVRPRSVPGAEAERQYSGGSEERHCGCNGCRRCLVLPHRSDLAGDRVAGEEQVGQEARRRARLG